MQEASVQMRVIDVVAGNGPGSHSSPRHRMPLHSGTRVRMPIDDVTGNGPG